MPEGRRRSQVDGLVSPTFMTDLHVAMAGEDDLERYIDLLEELAEWLQTAGISQWPVGCFRSSVAYYLEAIRQREVHLVFVDDALVGTLRILRRDAIVWPEVAADDAVYVYNLAVRRAWAGKGIGRALLEWSAGRAADLGRRFVRLDAMAHNAVLARYYLRAGFAYRGEVNAPYPAPVGTLRLKRFEKAVRRATP